MDIFKGKKLLVTGGTGSFGHAVVNKFLNSSLDEIRVFSRDEKKQDEMRKNYNTNKISYYLGDVRDYNSTLNAVQGVDFIYHAAALKQVPSCEFYPMEAVKTNIIGTENVLDAAINCRTEKVVCLSTDKAVYPINAMGISKAMMEKVIVSKARKSTETIICTTRYGNVMGSRGSVIPLFVNQIKSGNPLTITDPNMTRFMMTLEEAVDLTSYAFEKGKSGEIFVMKAPAAPIKTLAISLKITLSAPHHPVKIIGTRHGEKLFEVLMSREEKIHSEDHGNYFCIKPDNRDLNYNVYYDQGEPAISNAQEYNSHNTDQLDEKQMRMILNFKINLNNFD